MNAADELDGSLYLRQLAGKLYSRTQYTSSTTVISALLLVVLIYQLFYRLDYPVSEMIWNFAIYATPARLIYALESGLVSDSMQQARHGTQLSESKMHARKSEKVRRVLSLDGSGILGKLQRVKSFPAVGTMLRLTSSNKPPGLGNWDNSCYQNSVIQGLASLPSFAEFLDGAPTDDQNPSTKAALRDVIEKLNNHSNLGTMFWTPAQLKSMSSWQQQDAQEYFSKLMDEVEKETIQRPNEKAGHAGLAALQSPTLGQAESPAAEVNRSREVQAPLPKPPKDSLGLPGEVYSVIARNPLEGLLAQRVGCLMCGYVEGLSLIPFNCLTLPLGKQWLYDIRSCLDDYTTLEPIDGVECAKCTLLKSKTQLEKLRQQFLHSIGQEQESSAALVSGSLEAMVEERLNAVTEALDNEDFNDNTVFKKCQISQKARVSSTKTRQAVIARAPKILAIHINRSVFNETTGVLGKNYADVRFPLRLSLAPWCLGRRPVTAEGGASKEEWNTDPAKSMLGDILEEAEDDPDMYELRAALTHYGRHENGHYVCYRQHEPSSDDFVKMPKDEGSSWWRFSDEDVSAVSQDNVLALGDVFMLFYERPDAPLPKLDIRTHPVERQASNFASTEAGSNMADSTTPNVIGAERLEARLSEEDTQAEHGEETNQNNTSLANTVRDQEIDTEQAGQNVAAGDSVNNEVTLLDRAHDGDGLPKVLSVSPVPESDRTMTANPNPALHSVTIILDEQTAFSPQDSNPSLLPPFPTSQIDIRNVSHPMRTATPRSGRGSISRSQKGMGQVSSMVISH
ncbi:MAG: hypothetical protein Q9209_003389 [Squamulea sp. 1 TL-2023]